MSFETGKSRKCQYLIICRLPVGRNDFFDQASKHHQHQLCISILPSIDTARLTTICRHPNSVEHSHQKKTLLSSTRCIILSQQRKVNFPSFCKSLNLTEFCFVELEHELDITLTLLKSSSSKTHQILIVMSILQNRTILRVKLNIYSSIPDFCFLGEIYLAISRCFEIIAD